MAPATAETRNTVTVIARHRPDCSHRTEGSAKCKCPKALLVYEADKKKNRRLTAHTTSWLTAEQKAQALRDSWDPRLQRLRQFETAHETKQVTIEAAVALYCADLIARLGDNGTVAMARSLLGHVDPKSNTSIRNSHLFDWLATIPTSERPLYVADLTPAHLTRWRAAWKFRSDLTAAQRWSMVKGFFVFCEAQGWISDSPARKLKRLNIKKGNRTSIFTDEQYAAILDAVAIYEPENVPAVTRKAWQERITAFVELLRWSAMDLIDAVLWRPELLDSDGVLRYRRQKTDGLATVPLPAHVVAMLRNVPLERDSVGPGQPFRTNAKPASDTATWARRLGTLFGLAEINQVMTPMGRARKPHAKMLRDTCAVWHLRHGASLYTVAKILGHSDPTTTAKAYLPWVKELETAHIADARKSLAGLGKPGKPGNVVRIVNR